MNKKGVTLIELIVVMVIIAIAAGLIAPNLGGWWLPRYRLRSATRDIVSTIRTAQMKAVSNRMEYQVDFNVGTNSYILRYTNTGYGPFDDGSVRTAPSGITINIASLPGGIVFFNPDSSCPNGGTITVSYKKGGVTKAQKGIILNAATGRTKIVE
jgi:prepilin-type N-terminal cleavage/methylation domain-containing protein